MLQNRNQILQELNLTGTESLVLSNDRNINLEKILAFIKKHWKAIKLVLRGLQLAFPGISGALEIIINVLDGIVNGTGTLGDALKNTHLKEAWPKVKEKLEHIKDRTGDKVDHFIDQIIVFMDFITAD